MSDKNAILAAISSAVNAPKPLSKEQSIKAAKQLH
jgi:hypothetical protein